MYDYGALHLAYTTIRAVLFCVAVGFWILYFHEILFRSGRVRTQWLKKALSDIIILLCIAITTFLILVFISELRTGNPRH